MDYKQLGRRVRQERKNLNLTQERLAEKVDVSDAYIGQIERGQRSLSLDTLIRVAQCLGVSVDYLLQDTLPVDENQFMKQAKQLVAGRSVKEQQMLLDIIKVACLHLDELKMEQEKLG